MPLPDERPRQSVANLIGRFEQQTKRQTAAGSPRTSGVGVVSHSTGDSAPNDTPTREKREWPPPRVSNNNTSLDDKPPPYTSFWNRPNNAQVALAAAMTQAELTGSGNNTPPDKLPPDVDTNADLLATATTPEAARNTTASAPEPEFNQPKSPEDQPSDLPSGTAKSNLRPSQRSPVSSLVKTSAPRSSLSPRVFSSGARSTPRPSLTSSSQPLRPQLTGQSTISTSARQARTPSRTATTKTPSSASRPKTPANANVNSSASPSQRPKTPSSGLFAPTAASLARARNAQPQLPTPIKKVTLSSAVADRLSKPTAASMSRVRQPVAAAAAAPSSGTTTSPPKKAPAATALKARTSTSQGDAAAAKPASKTAKDNDADMSIALSDIPSEVSYQENRHHIVEPSEEDTAKNVEAVTPSNEDGRMAAANDDQVSDVIADDVALLPDDALNVLDEPAAHTTEVDVEPEVSASHDDVPATTSSTSDVQVPYDPAEPLLDPQPTPQTVESAKVDVLSPPSDQIDTPQEKNAGTDKDKDTIRPELSSSTTYVGDDIVDMVNMLESGSLKGRRLSITSIPDEVHEIPDEE